MSRLVGSVLLTLSVSLLAIVALGMLGSAVRDLLSAIVLALTLR